MARYRYKAIDTAGQLVAAVEEAASESAIVQRLVQRRLKPVYVQAARNVAPNLRFLFREIGKPKLSRGELAAFTRTLASLIGARVEVDTAVKIAARSIRQRRSREAVNEVAERIRAGESFSRALRVLNEWLPGYYIGMVLAGEKGACLDKVLARLAASLEATEATRARLRAALLYPAILLFMAIAAVVFLTLYVVPRFEVLFIQSQAELPALTSGMLWLSDWLGQNGLWLLLATVGLILVARWYLHKPSAKLKLDRAILLLPVAGPLIQKEQIGRVLEVWSMLLANGVQQLSAITVATGSTNNICLRRDLQRIAERLKNGAMASVALEESEFFKDPLPHLAQVGEKTGDLASVLGIAAEQLSRESQWGVQRLVTLLTPTVTLVLGAIVALIMASLMAVVLDLNDTLL